MDSPSKLNTSIFNQLEWFYDKYLVEYDEFTYNR